jgi:hypothetical protein
MKSQITLQNNKGFLIAEIMIAISLFVLFTITTYTMTFSMDGLKIWSIQQLVKIKDAVIEIDNIIDSDEEAGEMFGNNSRKIKIEPFSVIKSDYIESWGDTTCYPRVTFDESKLEYLSDGIFLGTGNKSTDIEVKNSIAYISTNSTTQSQPDFFIIDVHDKSNPIILSSLNTGPGVSSLVVAGPYAYLANTSSISQLQIIDMHDRANPSLISQLRLPLPEASTTPSRSNTIFYRNGYVYIGTNKWDGNEFQIIDVRNPSSPSIVGSIETDTLVNDIFVYKNKAYIATSDVNQMRIIDVSDKHNPITLETFSSTGWETQQGRVVEYFENTLGLGRTVGGINRIHNHEAFIFASSTTLHMDFSKDIPGGVYGYIIRPSFVFLLTHASDAQFQVWNKDFTNKTFEMSLLKNPVKMKCDWSTIYFATGDEYGLSILTL